MNKQMEKQNNIKDKALVTFSVFSSHETICGLPSNVFVMGAGITFVIAVLLQWVFGIAFGCLYFYGMYEIHKDDPKAFFVWKKALARQWTNQLNRWKSTNFCSTHLIVLHED